MTNQTPYHNNQEAIKARAALKALHYYPPQPVEDDPFYAELVAMARDQVPQLINRLAASDLLAVHQLLAALLAAPPSWPSSPAGHMLIDLPHEMAELCEDAKVDPDQVIADFIRNLCAMPGSSGSDERMMARDYFQRMSYSYMQ